MIMRTGNILNTSFEAKSIFEAILHYITYIMRPYKYEDKTLVYKILSLKLSIKNFPDTFRSFYFNKWFAFQIRIC
jgi:hypothetical protein